jgi:hypothetical protein
MNLYSELISATQSDLNVDDDSPLFPLATIKTALNRAYIKCGALFKWPMLKDAKKTSTEATKEYYDYPDTWRPDSIWKVMVDSIRYGEEPDGSPLKFDDYLAWREDYPNSTEKKWANQERRFFIYPVPTADGDYNIEVHGYKNVEALDDNSDTTIFSYGMPECNEAIVLEASAILKNKGEEQKSGDFLSNQAKQILIVAWDKLKKEQSKYEKIAPFFDVPDLFSGKSSLKEELGWND